MPAGCVAWRRSRGPCAILLVAAGLQGCVFKDLAEYPADWPALAGPSDCASLTGRYRNEATATTEELYRPRVNAYLVDLLRQGLTARGLETDASIDAVSLDASALAYAVSRPGQRGPVPGESSASWSCLP